MPSMEELHLSLGVQIKKLERLAGIEIKELLPLSGLYLVETKECDMLSEITPEISALLERLGVCIDEV